VLVRGFFDDLSVEGVRTILGLIRGDRYRLWLKAIYGEVPLFGT